MIGETLKLCVFTNMFWMDNHVVMRLGSRDQLAQFRPTMFKWFFDDVFLTNDIDVILLRLSMKHHQNHGRFWLDEIVLTVVT